MWCVDQNINSMKSMVCVCATVLKKRGLEPENIRWNSNCRACFIEQVTMEDNAKVVAAVIF